MNENKKLSVEDKLKNAERMLSTKRSPCCNAPIDESEVIKEGTHRGHGPRFCSQCKKMLFWV